MSKDDYNWLDDPFDEKKDKHIAEQQMSSGSKLAIVLGCFGALVFLVIAFIFMLVFAGSLLGPTDI